MTLITLTAKRRYKTQDTTFILGIAKINILTVAVVFLFALSALSVFYIFNINKFNFYKANFYDLENRYITLETSINESEDFLYNNEYLNLLENKAKEMGFVNANTDFFVKAEDYVILTKNAR